MKLKLKSARPITPGLRHRVSVPSIPHSPFKPLVVGKPSTGFRNNAGIITVRHRGGGHKRSLRVVDFLGKDARSTPFEVLRWDYDPNRTGFLALCRTVTPFDTNVPLEGKSVRIEGHKYFYKLATDAAPPGTKVIGNTKPLKEFPIGTEVHNIEVRVGEGAKLVRAAGSVATLVGLTNKAAIIKMPSSQTVRVMPECIATLGRVSNRLHNLETLGKAGASRWAGRRPTVRGEVMNPVDHPLGGKTRGGVIRNIWGKLAKFVPTRK